MFINRKKNYLFLTPPRWGIEARCLISVFTGRSLHPYTFIKACNCSSITCWEITATCHPLQSKILPLLSTLHCSIQTANRRCQALRECRKCCQGFYPRVQQANEILAATQQQPGAILSPLLAVVPSPPSHQFFLQDLFWVRMKT
jgi:hypothetical protein